MVLASVHLARSTTSMQAFNGLQCALMRRYLARGGTIEGWVIHFAARYRLRYGWMLEAPTGLDGLDRIDSVRQSQLGVAQNVPRYRKARGCRCA